MKLTKNYHLYALIAIAFWSVAYILTRVTLHHFSPMSLGFLRYFIATIVLLTIAVAFKIKPPRKRDIPLFAISGTFGFFLNMIAFNIGTSRITASQSSVIIATTTAITAILARIFLKEKIQIHQKLAIFIEFIGIIIVTETYKSINLNIGSLWVLTAAVSLSIYNLLQRKLTVHYSPLKTTMYSIFAGTILLSIFAHQAFYEVKEAPTVQLVYIIILGVVSSALAYVVWTKALSLAKEVTSVSNYMFLTPLFTTILGFFLIKENPPNSTLVGGIIILGGIIIYNFGGKSKSKP